MKRRSTIRPVRYHGLLWACAAPAVLLAGCGTSGSYEPPEVGWHVDAINKVQADRAQADELVIYRYEWADGAVLGRPVLSGTGERHLQRMETALLHGTVPGGAAVTIEPSADPALDAARQAAIANRLRQDTPGVSAAVVVALPRAHGIEGEEAANVDADTPRGGQTNGSGSGGSSGSGGLGGGGGGLGGGGISSGGL